MAAAELIPSCLGGTPGTMTKIDSDVGSGPVDLL